MNNGITHARLSKWISEGYEVWIFTGGHSKKFETETFKYESDAIIYLQREGFQMVGVRDRELWFVRDWTGEAVGVCV